ncbi:hypothetical protein HON86_00750 [Candidatus Woesearchaeota archaeon]|jgi:hypothetical protein|nr:hypothetical protein [Candidatus Woesearchaeota archaeon]MBT4835132.1 hypothetical protein [Candidatus Woesearchaeota archaeon]MBT6735067.1 hypothetical protein [Candidatus Woesearchaeota archaeon]MBT7170066.1 hypothetical protein [Candidatus Woesearchaeota archaeon]MBT7474839.1 hypothetical protein [Candidatus Woesearchaeota archaeon]
MEYAHPCENLENLSTIGNEVAKQIIPCIYNDIINKNYICPKKNKVPTECKKIYYEIKSQIMKIENDIENLEKLIK